MAILIGIDEAGFGPILGPLVISSTVFSVPDELLNADMWQILRKSVGKNRKHLSGRLLITDSKKAYSTSLGTKHLERTTLASIGCFGKRPSNLNELLGLLCPDSLERLKNYPWYNSAGEKTLSADETDIKIVSSVFANNLDLNNIKLLNLQSRCLDVAYYNELVRVVKNKSNVVFSVISQLIKSAWDRFAEDEFEIIVDRQGGRVRYRKNLQQMFEGMDLKILKETAERSSYELKTGDRMIRLHFIVEADKKFLPVSLASMASKYIRELLVSNINHHFTSFHTELKPTAGYWKDGLRFISDLRKYLPDVKYDSNQLIRCR